MEAGGSSTRERTDRNRPGGYSCERTSGMFRNLLAEIPRREQGIDRCVLPRPATCQNQVEKRTRRASGHSAQCFAHTRASHQDEARRLCGELSSAVAWCVEIVLGFLPLVYER